jgi:hypothetical protein
MRAHAHVCAFHPPPIFIAALIPPLHVHTQEDMINQKDKLWPDFSFWQPNIASFSILLNI